MKTQTHGIHQGTHDAAFQHPVARNLQWRDVRSMLAALSEMTGEHGERVKFTRNGQTLTVHLPKRKDFSDVDELMNIRHFLERSDAGARTDAAGAGRHLHHVEEGDATGQRKPELKGFYAAVAKTLEHAEQILVFCSGTGASSAMEQLLAELDRHHKAVRGRVVGSYVVDEHHLTKEQLLAKARDVYATAATRERDAASRS